ncbi:hypothetical protein NPIL_680331 [Nephila pilipes]|uniref:Uncharacterized protein n=1 Tax=Nephila pilipes TaxID=299642 RepID=A0A8X6UTS0_NEPPI|nr:hypothetical protein NPIL_680331 [Nephila pilipes]
MAQNSSHCLSFRTLHKFRFLHRVQEIRQSIIGFVVSYSWIRLHFPSFGSNRIPEELVVSSSAPVSSLRTSVGHNTPSLSQLELEESLCLGQALADSFIQERGYIQLVGLQERTKACSTPEHLHVMATEGKHVRTSPDHLQVIKEVRCIN